MHRSYLYAPANRPDLLAKAASSAADAVIADLEDAVALTQKDAARGAVADVLRNQGDGAKPMFVRINSGPSASDDVGAVVPAGAAGIYLPKADIDAALRLSDMLDEVERQSDREVGSVPVVALIETARGLLDAAALATHPRTCNLAIGEADLTAELRINPSVGGHEIWPLRMQLVVASAAAGIGAPTGPVSTDFHDLDELKMSTEELRDSGFGARSAIHPAQVGIINEAFTPSPADREAAERLVERFDASVAHGEAVCLDEDGRMIDEAVVRSARRILEQVQT